MISNKKNIKQKFLEITWLTDEIGKLVEKDDDNHGHNILRIFDILPNFQFTLSETKSGLLVINWYIPVASRVAEQFMT